MLVAGHYMAQLKLTNIKIAGETPYINTQSMAVRNDWPILADILQKALDSITQTEREEIYFKWVQIRYEHGVDYSFLWKSTAVSAAFILLLSVWIYRLRKEIKQRKKAEQAQAESEYQWRSHLNNTPIGVMQWNLDLTITDWNPAAERIFGYSKAELLGKDGLCVVPKSIYQEVKTALIQLLLEDSFSDQYRHGINNNITKSGKIITCEWFNTPITSSNGTITGIAALFQDITSKETAKDQIETSLAEKNILLKELYHRTKNNMQLISSFLILESQYYQSPDVVELVESVNSRIQTMSMVHEKLCQSENLSRLNIREYIEEIVSLIRSYNISTQEINCSCMIEEIELSIDTAIPLGLVINEIVTNTFKHAFPEIQSGNLLIKLYQTKKDSIVLEISDDGVGFPKGREKSTSTFGMITIMNIIEKQMQGKIEVSSDSGVSYRIVIQVSEELERV
jgi:PAS domain S-box-containing protein